MAKTTTSQIIRSMVTLKMTFCGQIGRSFVIEMEPWSLRIGLMMPSAQAVGMAPYTRKCDMALTMGVTKIEDMLMNTLAEMPSTPGANTGFIVSKVVRKGETT